MVRGVETGDLDEVLVCVLLITRQSREDAGALAIPFIGREFVTTKQLVQ